MMPSPIQTIFRRLCCLCLLCFPALMTQAQDARVSDNAVNAIAKKMYCPVCENIPLDECQTRACLEWKEEIRQQLSQGKTENAVIDSFVKRFGDQVVGIPQDPLLRALTILVPLLTALLAISLGIATFRRFTEHQRLTTKANPSQQAIASDQAYRQRIEEDAQALR